MKIINHTKTHHCFLNSFENIRLSRMIYKLELNIISFKEIKILI